MRAIVIVTVVAGCLFLITGFVMLPRQNQPFAIGVNPVPIENEDERIKGIRQAFDAEPNGPLVKVFPNEFQKLFDDFGKIMKAGGHGAEVHWNIDRIVLELNRDGFLDRLSGRDRRDLSRGFEMGLKAQMPQMSERLSYDRTEIRGVRWLIPDQEAIVIVRHVVNELGMEFGFKVRWWVVKSDGVWKIYDFEDLAVGSRITVVMGTLLKSLIVPGQQPDLARLKAMQAEAQKIQVAMSHLMAEDFDECEKEVSRVNLRVLPNEFQAIGYCLRGISRANLGKGVEAIEDLKQAERVMPNLPLAQAGFTLAYFIEGDYEKAIQHGRTYVDQVGSDGIVNVLVGRCLIALEKYDEAAVEFRRALDDDTQNAETLDLLRQCLPKGKKSELGDRLMAMRDPEGSITLLVDQAKDDNDAEAVEAYTLAFAKKFPNNVIVRRKAIETHIRNNNLADAKKLLVEALRDASLEDQRKTINEVLYSFIEADEEEAIYAVTPAPLRREVFDDIATDFDEMISDYEFDEPEWDEMIDNFESLLHQHSRLDQNDPMLPYHRAMMAVLREDREGAEKLYGVGMEMQQTDEHRLRYRSRRVENLRELGRSLEAYEKIGPRNETFRQLSLSLEDTPDVLESLVAAHRKNVPQEPLLDFYTGKIAYQRTKWDEALRSFGAYRQRLADNADDVGSRWESSQALELSIRCQLKLKRFPDARKLLIEAEKAKAYNAPLLRVLIPAAEGNLVATEREMDVFMKEKYRNWNLYYDEDMGPLMKSEKFAKLREKYPDPKLMKKMEE